MFRGALSEHADAQVVAAAATSAGTAVTSSSVDLAGFAAVEFQTAIQTADAGNSVKLQESDDNSTWADIAGAARVPAADDELVVLDHAEATKRYVRCVITRSGANTATEIITARRYHAKKTPVATPATTSVTRTTAA